MANEGYFNTIKEFVSNDKALEKHWYMTVIEAPLFKDCLHDEAPLRNKVYVSRQNGGFNST